MTVHRKKGHKGMALGIFARVGRAIKRGLGLHMIDAQGVVTLQEMHKVLDEIKALKYEVQMAAAEARTGRMHAAEHQDNLFNQAMNIHSTVLDMQVSIADIKYKMGNEAGTKDQGYRIMDHVDALQFAIEELKSSVNGMHDIVERIDADPVGRVAAALAEAARNLEVR